MDPEEEAQLSSRPWSARRPQSLLFSLIFIVLAVALVWQAFDYIGRGLGGVVPYLIVVGGPAIAAYYVWYFNLRNFDAEYLAATSDTSTRTSSEHGNGDDRAPALLESLRPLDVTRGW